MVQEIKHKVQNILTIDAGLLVHQVNCQGKMGLGLARDIRKQWPKVYYSYTDQFIKGNWALGKIQVIRVSPTVVVCNLAGQIFHGSSGIYTKYDAVEEGLVKATRFAKAEDLKICIPYKMGCGLAGGHWPTVKEIIARICGDCTIYHLT